MEIITKAALIHSLTDIEVFSIKVNEVTYQIVRKRLELEHLRIINILKELKNQGEIKSIARPKNKRLQKVLNSLVKTKKILKQSIRDISEVFYK